MPNGSYDKRSMRTPAKQLQRSAFGNGQRRPTRAKKGAKERTGIFVQKGIVACRHKNTMLKGASKVEPLAAKASTASKGLTPAAYAGLAKSLEAKFGQGK